MERFRAANLEYLDRNRGLISLQGFFYPSMTLLSRVRVAARPVAGQPGGRDRTNLAWRVRRLQCLPRDAQLADDRVRLGDEHPSARTGIVEADAGGPGRRADHQRPRSTDAGRRDLRSRAGLSFATSSFPILDRPGECSTTCRSASRPARRWRSSGGTGSGKSTLISLLPRLYDPPPGTVFIDGVDVRDIPLERLRRSIGFVPQEPFLFSDTVGENIAFGLPEADQVPTRVREAAATARLDIDVDTFPKGFDTLVGERGITLSGGQKQRTALARAILIDPAILILDDALSAVDTYTEEAILSRLRGVMQARTSLIVAHRVSTVRDADVIVVLDDGRIAEQGSHDEPRAAWRTLRRSHRKQQLEEELAEA